MTALDANAPRVVLRILFGVSLVDKISDERFQGGHRDKPSGKLLVKSDKPEAPNVPDDRLTYKQKNYHSLVLWVLGNIRQVVELVLAHLFVFRVGNRLLNRSLT